MLGEDRPIIARLGPCRARLTRVSNYHGVERARNVGYNIPMRRDDHVSQSNPNVQDEARSIDRCLDAKQAFGSRTEGSSGC